MLPDKYLENTAVSGDYFRMKALIGVLAAYLILLPLYAQRKPCDARKLPQFENYRATTLQGQPKQPILKTRLEREYRTAIREAVKGGTNFAGHYVVAQWGCGSGCRGFVVVDLRSGNVFDPPFRDLNFHYPPDGSVDSSSWSCMADPIGFRADSELLIVEGCLDSHQCGRTYYRIDDTGLRQIAYDPDLMPDGSVAPF